MGNSDTPAPHRQLTALGFSVRAIETRIWAGRLQAVHRNVYSVGHRRVAREIRQLLSL